MRLLVECPQCNRQYDASKLEIGARFHCHCGAVLKVSEPKSHDAAVVCCAQCGGQRSEGEPRCEFCGGEFTLHERDLDTVCPHCFARVSRKARFCHYCATRISPEMVAGETSQLVCPTCGIEQMLMSRAWDNVSVAECQRCTGLWLGNETFRNLADRAAAVGEHTDLRGSAPKARLPQAETPAPKSRTKYRPCAMCGQLMVRQNYGRRSGVVVDRCKDHGVWFDADELPRILDWIRAGGLARANQEQAAQEAQAESLRRRQGPTGHGGGLGEPRDDDTISGSIFEVMLEGLSHWFFRL